MIFLDLNVDKKMIKINLERNVEFLFGRIKSMI